MSLNQSDPRVLVILPTYNERIGVPKIVSEIHEVLPTAEVLIIDDASPDGTGDIADVLARTHPWVRVRHRPSKQGLGTAYLTGFSEAIDRGFHFAIQMDSDGSHQAADLPKLLAAAQAGASLVIGTRWMPGGSIVGWSTHRKVISRVGTWVARLALRSQLRDLTSGFRVFRSDCFTDLNLNSVESQGYSFQVELAWIVERSGHSISEVPIAFIERAAGRSKMSPVIVAEALFRVIRWGVRLRVADASLPNPPVSRRAPTR